LLLQSTDLVWTVIFARIINKERLGFLEAVAVSLSIIGAIFVSLAAGGELEAPALGLMVNLLTPIFLALCITTLRTGTAELSRRDNCLGGTMSAVEFTAIKLALSSLVALLLSFTLENQAVLSFEGRKHAQAWWEALANYPIESLGLLFCGGIFVLIFQVNITWLSVLTSAVAVGIVGEVKVLPQWLINALFNFKVDLSPLNLVGAALSLAGSVLFATAASLPRRLVLSRKGFEWRPRDKMREKLLDAEIASSDQVETESK
jgi:drug/metabolite transporter (DMT)-like permease